MKKVILTIVLIMMVLLSTAEVVSAQEDKINIKGEVTAITGDTITVSTKKGATYDIIIPAEIDISEIEIGDSVVIKAITEEDGWLATLVKEVGVGDDDEEEIDLDDLEGFQEHTAYCDVDKKEEPHPLAPLIAERYGVTEDLVMDYYCEGYSMGAIMLALRTSQLDGMSVDPDTLLFNRASGKGWGQLWKDLGLIGSEKEGHSPPGQLKKP